MTEQRNVSLEEDYRKISELYIKEQQKVGELEQINQNLTRQLMIYEGAARLREEHIHRLELSVAHAIFRWASARRLRRHHGGFTQTEDGRLGRQGERGRRKGASSSPLNKSRR